MKHVLTPSSSPYRRTKRTRVLSNANDTSYRKSSLSTSLFVRGAKVNRTSFGSLMRANTPLKYNIGAVTTSVLHNLAYTIPVTQAITIGTTDSNRIGDEIYLKFMKLRFTLNSGSSSGAYIHRVLVGYSNVQNNTNNTAAAGIYSAAVQGVTANQIAVDGIINPKNFTLLYDETFDLPSEIPSTKNSHTVEHTIPLERKFQYQTAGSVYGKLNNLYVVHISSTIDGTTGISQTGAYDVTWALAFVDN